MLLRLSQDPETTKDPVEFVQRLLNEKDKYDAVIARSFGMDKSFQNSLNQAFEHFLNLNQRSPEFISLFMDDKLRKGLKARALDWTVSSTICPSHEANIVRAADLCPARGTPQALVSISARPMSGLQ